jgi:hypothetical protein
MVELAEGFNLALESLQKPGSLGQLGSQDFHGRLPTANFFLGKEYAAHAAMP